MIKVENIKVFNFEGAFRGLRNPMNSWEKSDSYFGFDRTDSEKLHEIALAWHNKELNSDSFLPENLEVFDKYNNWLLDNSSYLDWPDDVVDARFIGPNDMKLAQRMIGGGAEEAKFLRQIFVSMDITSAMYWWKEMDTYKVGTTANSCSTMHKLTSQEINSEMFSFDPTEDETKVLEIMRNQIVNYCEALRQEYNTTKDKRIWRELVSILPMGFNQLRTWTANYQVLRNIYFQRRNHKLKEWQDFTQIITTLPYAKDLICYEK